MNLGTLLKEQADRDESQSATKREEILRSARECLKEALTLSEEGLYGEEHPITGGILRVLASVAYVEDRQEDAVTYRERAEAIREEALRTVDPDIVDKLDKGAEALVERGLCEEVIVYQARSLELRAQTSEERGFEAASSLFNMARLLRLLGRDAEACSYLEQALAACEGVPGECESFTGFVRENLTILDT
jgi:tetratricopeptide (TPR) repeat protein